MTTTRIVGRARGPLAQLSVQIDADARLVSLAGELDFAGVPRLFERVASLAPPGDIVIDLTELTFIDASGLGAAVRIRNSQLANGFDLHIVRANSRVVRVFTVCGLAQLLEPPHADWQMHPRVNAAANVAAQ